MNVFFVSLGCDKNLVDSEHMLAVLSKSGLVITDDETKADVIIINTCSFICDAKEESIQAIIDYGSLKESASCKALIVTGCLAQRYAGEIRKELPEVDAIVGVDETDRIYEAVERAVAGGRPDLISKPGRLASIACGRQRGPESHYAYLKIAEGCDKRCTYCAIPGIRGPYRSYPMEELLAEAKKLAETGARELILVAQETTIYGVDIYGKKSLPELVRRLSDIKEIEWIRLLYCYPEEIDDEFIRMMETEPKVCHYVDMPIQHCCDDVLHRMGRRTDRAFITELIGRLRERVPDICLRTTLISGFPGETPKMHSEMLGFVEEMKFDRLGVFPYSREEGTPAAKFSKQVSERTAKKRADEIMQLEQDIIFDKTSSLVGSSMMFIIDGYYPDEEVYVARSYRDAPDVDGMAFLKCDRELFSGDMVRARVTEVNGIDIIAKVTAG